MALPHRHDLKARIVVGDCGADRRKILLPDRKGHIHGLHLVDGRDRNNIGGVNEIADLIRATIPNEDEALWPGSIVTIRLTLYEEDAVVVPTSAVQLSSVGTYVYAVENSIAVIKPIEVTRANADEMIVRSGLSGGETLVTNGHLLLSDHVLVSVQNP
jgi:multidrug efflux pump subunit AcrA (membrane-fusion protein)